MIRIRTIRVWKSQRTHLRQSTMPISALWVGLLKTAGQLAVQAVQKKKSYSSIMAVISTMPCMPMKEDISGLKKTVIHTH